MDPVTITLEGMALAIRPLTLGQMEDLRIAVLIPVAADPQENVRQYYKRQCGILAAALKSDHPALDEAAIRNLRATGEEVAAAVATILALSGLVAKDKDAAPGEAAPAQAPA